MQAKNSKARHGLYCATTGRPEVVVEQQHFPILDFSAGGFELRTHLKRRCNLVPSSSINSQIVCVGCCRSCSSDAFVFGNLPGRFGCFFV
jgi:hypothetical protein